jgi:hypothetical protein
MNVGGAERSTSFERLAMYGRDHARRLFVRVTLGCLAAYFLLEISQGDGQGVIGRATYLMIWLSIWFAGASCLAVLLMRKLCMPKRVIDANKPWGAVEALAEARVLASKRATMLANVFAVVTFAFLLGMYWVMASGFVAVLLVFLRKGF